MLEWDTALLLGLTVFSGLLAVCFLLLMRQLGDLEQRSAPLRERETDEGPATGPLQAEIQVTDLAGRRWALGPARQRPLLVLFVGSSCQTCGELLRTLGNGAELAAEPLDVLLCSDEQPADLRRLLQEHVGAELPAVASPELVRVWNVTQVPFAVLLAADGSVLGSKGTPRIGQLRAFITNGLSPRLVTAVRGENGHQPVNVAVT